MNKENTKYLVENYKEFFEYLKDHKGPIIPIQFGFECGDGWFMLLNELMGDIQNHIKNEALLCSPNQHAPKNPIPVKYMIIFCI